MKMFILFLGLLLSLPTTQTHAQPSPIPPDLAVRKSAYSAAAKHDLESYAKGVAQMKKWSAENPRNPVGWTYQANMHGTLDHPPQDQTAHDMLWNECQHNSFLFLSWHRMYLYYFERIVRKASGDNTFALPYWGYSNPDQAEHFLPSAFRVPANARNNPLFVPNNNPRTGGGRDPRVNDANSPGKLDDADVDAESALALTNFSPNTRVQSESFGGSAVHDGTLGDGIPGFLERVPHGAVHGAVGGRGGLMSAFATAGRDPIFWLHHANIDRLWEKWLRLAEGRANPSENSYWMDHKFTFFDANGNRVQLSGKEVVATAQSLGYRYDDIDTPLPPVAGGTSGAPSVAAAPPVEPTRTTLSSSEGKPIVLGDAAVSLHVPISKPNSDALRASVNAAAQAGPGVATAAPAILLKLEGIKFKQTPAGNYKVFLNLPDGAPADIKGPHYVGLITFFNLQVHSEKAHPNHDERKSEFSFDVTRQIAALEKLNLWKEGELKVSFIQSTPTGKDGKALTFKADNQCQIERVSLVKVSP